MSEDRFAEIVVALGILLLVVEGIQLFGQLTELVAR